MDHARGAAAARRRDDAAGVTGSQAHGLLRRDLRTPTIGPGVKLIIQIPCLDEERTLPTVLAELPREVEGFDAVEWLVIDDGSTDRTAEVARAGGADHLVRLHQQQGSRRRLPGRPRRGAEARRRRDRQHRRRQPVPRGRRSRGSSRRSSRAAPTWSSATARWSRSSTSRRPRRRCSGSGSWVVRRASDTDVPDTTSGFRAYNREAALQLVVVSNFTYTLEALIQAGKMLVAVEHVPIKTNPTRSRVAALPEHRRPTCAATRSRSSAPTSSTSRCACSRSPPARSRSAPCSSWMPFVLDVILNGDSSGHVQSLILGAVLAVIAVQMFGLGVIGDMLAGQRVISQRIFERVRRLELKAGIEPSHLEGPGASGRVARGGRARARAAEDDLPVDEVLAERREAHRGPGGDQVVDPEPEVEDEEDAVLERPEDRRGDRGLEQLAAERRRPGRGTPTAAGARS